MKKVNDIVWFFDEIFIISAKPEAMAYVNAWDTLKYMLMNIIALYMQVNWGHFKRSV